MQYFKYLIVFNLILFSSTLAISNESVLNTRAANINEEITNLKSFLAELNENQKKAKLAFQKSEREWIEAKNLENEGDLLSKRKKNFAELKYNKNKSTYERKLNKISMIEVKINDLIKKREIANKDIPENKNNTPNIANAFIEKKSTLKPNKETSFKSDSISEPIVNNLNLKEEEQFKDSLENTINQDDRDSEIINETALDWPNRWQTSPSSIDFAKNELKRLQSKNDSPTLGKISLKSSGIGDQKMKYLSEGIYTTTIRLDEKVSEIRILKKVYIVDQSQHTLKGSEPIYRIIFDVASLSSPKFYIFEEKLIN